MSNEPPSLGLGIVLLYTYDAADEKIGLGLGGRLITYNNKRHTETDNEHNNHTNNVELWLHVNGFSMTTRRHKSLFFNAFINQQKDAGFPYDVAVKKIYRTGCFDTTYRTRSKWNADPSDLRMQTLTRPHRAEACQYGQNYDEAMENLHNAALRPRLHDETRFTLLHLSLIHLLTFLRKEECITWWSRVP